MAGRCSKLICYPEETGCNSEGLSDVTKCKYYKKNASESQVAKGEVTSENDWRIPWTGNSCGLNDLDFISARSKPILVGIAGSHSAGKTTFLASLFCLLRSGQKIEGYEFAGSLTLIGWENIAWYLSWKTNGDIQFPPHTSVNAGRVPGLLHLTFRTSLGEFVDLLLTDAPGEWFDDWAINKNDNRAEGARWIYRKADAFLLFADSEMLGGDQVGQARQQLKLVIDRLRENIEERPFGLIWAKSDKSLSSSVKETITTYVKRVAMSSLSEFDVSVREGKQGKWHKGILESIKWMLDSRTEKRPYSIKFISKSVDVFFKKGLRHEFK